MTESLAQRRMALGREQSMLGRLSACVRDVIGIERAGGGVPCACRADRALALAAGGSSDPPGQRGRLTDLVQVVHQAQPDALADVVGVSPAEPVPAANRLDQRGVALDEGVPRLD